MRDTRFENKIQTPTKPETGADGILVISVRENEVVRIGDDVHITLKEAKRGESKLAIRAPKTKRIERMGVLDPWTNEILTRKDPQG